MRKIQLIFCFILLLYAQWGYTQQSIDSLLPLRGFCIAAPSASFTDSFVNFINHELAPKKVNTLILRVDYNYQYQSHPELRDPGALSKEDVKKLVKACKQNNIRLIPQVNLLGHQSWASTPSRLLAVYPQFDETPHVKLPAKYQWPNADSLYCKSYCPLHPEVHQVVFDIVDEICDVFETDAFHAGMDEVFYIGDARCPRCAGKDKAVLFAGEVKKIREHLQQKGRELWIWGDRLIDGEETGLGMWEASRNNTYPAVDMIPKDVVICDWHYERADKTAVYFAMKGFRVITCPWRSPDIATTQLKDMLGFRQSATAIMKPRFLGMMQTSWSGAEGFVRAYYKASRTSPPYPVTDWNTFITLYGEIGKLQ